MKKAAPMTTTTMMMMMMMMMMTTTGPMAGLMILMSLKRGCQKAKLAVPSSPLPRHHRRPRKLFQGRDKKKGLAVSPP
jgi:hypothetical protein